MKYILLFFVISSVVISCKKELKVNSNTIQDSARIVVENIEPKKSDQQLLKEQEEFLKIQEEIVEKFIEIRKGNGYIYKLFCEKQRNDIVNFKYIEVLKDKKMLQKIKVDSAYVYNKREIEFEVNDDVNFDGRNDIKLINWVGMHGSDFRYSFFIFNEKQLKYIYFPFLYNINAPEIDTKNKRIIESGGIGGANNYEHIYKWKRGTLILDSGYDTNPMTGEVEKFKTKNGKIISIE